MAGFPKIATTLLIGKKMEDLKTKYEYLDQIPLEGWLWEFIRRKQHYKNIFSELIKELQNTELTASGVFFSSQESLINLNASSSIKDNLERLESEFGIMPNPRANPEYSRGYYIKPIGDYGFLALPDPTTRYCQEDISPYPIIKARPLRVTEFREEALQLPPTKLHQYCHTLIEKISVTDKSQMLYIGIALNSRKEVLKDSFDFLLDKYINEEPPEVYTKFKKWKLYLIYYDLYLPQYTLMCEKRKQGITVYNRNIKRDIAYKVQKAFPQDTADWNLDKKKNWWKFVDYGLKEAKKLIIEDGYKKYLFL
jgi:hypothetical protein